MFTEEGLRQREQSTLGLGLEGFWFNLGIQHCGSMAEL